MNSDQIILTVKDRSCNLHPPQIANGSEFNLMEILETLTLRCGQHVGAWACVQIVIAKSLKG